MERPTPDDIRKYYDDKPALFKNRRIYTVQEYVIEAKPEVANKVAGMLQAAKSPAAFTDALKAAGLRYAFSSGTRPAEAIPMDTLGRVSTMSEGQGFVITGASGAKAFWLTAAVSAPVSFDQASPAIEQYLLNERRRKKLEADIKALRAGATIQYVGKFAGAAASAPAATTPSSVVENSSASAASPTAASDSAATLETIGADAISKGSKGLK